MKKKKFVPGAESPPAGTRNTIGGAAILAKEQKIPECQKCSARMILFLQFDLPKDPLVKLKAGSHFLAFMCPECNEINNFCSDGPRPERFWEEESGTFSLILNSPGVDEYVADEDEYLIAKELTFVDADEEVQVVDPDNKLMSGSEDFKYGGLPLVLNNEVNATCGCGSPMHYFCMIPENYGFFQKEGAPEQPDSFSSSEYGLFLGNIVYFLACESNCSPLAVTAILYN